jgi:hypothetical protein
VLQDGDVLACFHSFGVHDVASMRLFNFVTHVVPLLVVGSFCTAAAPARGWVAVALPAVTLTLYVTLLDPVHVYGRGCGAMNELSMATTAALYVMCAALVHRA